MNTLTIGKTEFEIPSNVNELSGRQQVWLAGLKAQASPFWILYALLLHPVNGRKRIWLTLSFLLNLVVIPLLDKITFERFTWTVHLPSTDDVADAIDFLTEWIGNDDRPLVNPPFAKLWYWYVSPGLGLKELNFGQFIQSEQLYLQYLNSKDLALLPQLASVLYVPLWSVWFPKFRHLAISEKALSKRTQRLGKFLSENELRAILHYYTGSRRAVVLLNPEVFGPAKSTSSGPAPAFDLRKLRREHADWFNHLAENPRNNAATQNLPVWEVLSSMCSKIREAARIEAELKKNNP